jgi:Uncharacterized conserved protein
VDSGEHFQITPVRGAFTDYDVDLQFSPDDLENSSLNVTIDVNSIDTKNERRDGHLKSEDFFNVAEFSTITFASQSIEAVGENQFVAKGELTIRDVTREFELPFTLLGMVENPFQEGVTVAAFQSEFQIDRMDYEVGQGDWVADLVAAHEVDVELLVEVNAEL